MHEPNIICFLNVDAMGLAASHSATLTEQPWWILLWKCEPK